MRSADEIRARVLVSLTSALKWPSMWGGELLLLHLLTEIAFIDEKEKLHEAQWREVYSLGYGGSQLVTGAFLGLFGGHAYRYYNEVASVYSAVAHSLGFIELDRVLELAEWAAMKKGLRRLCRERDWTSGQIVEKFGTPSISIGGSQSHVLAYSNGQSVDQWIFFDFESTPSIDRAGTLLRNVRLAAMNLSRGVILTPHGRDSAMRPL
jgi:hypothetical protein